MHTGEQSLSITFTIVVLTYNRKNVLFKLLKELGNIQRRDLEVVVVDNGSRDGTAQMIQENFAFVRLIRLEENIGIAGRNSGLMASKGKYIVTLDDDVFGLDRKGLDHLQAMFEGDPSIGAICFKVTDFYSGEVCNWCHPYQADYFSNSFFQTNEISEGAVAFRKDVLTKTGLYSERFFISHEGADLAARILDVGYEIYYTPLLMVRHKYAEEARKKWRRYYYDTRNSFWLAIRNYRFPFAVIYLTQRTFILLIYSLRDGFTHYWLKAIKDTLLELPEMLRQRHPISTETQSKIRRLNRNRPSVVYFIRKRFRSKQVRI